MFQAGQLHYKKWFNLFS